MISYLGSLVQFSPAAGRAGRCRQISPCVGSTHRVPATLGLPLLTGVCFPQLHCSGSQLLCMERALRCVLFQFSGSPRKRRLGCACVLGIPRRSSSGSQRLEGRTLPGCGAPSPLRGPSLFPLVPFGCVHLVFSLTLPADVDHPESQEVFG